MLGLEKSPSFLSFEGSPKVLYDMDKFPKHVALGPELPGAGNLGNEHGEGVDPHDDQEHLECLPQGEEGVEGVGGRGSRGKVWVCVVPPVQLTPLYALVQSSQLDGVISWDFFNPMKILLIRSPD